MTSFSYDVILGLRVFFVYPTLAALGAWMSRGVHAGTGWRGIGVVALRVHDYYTLLLKAEQGPRYICEPTA